MYLKVVAHTFMLLQYEIRPSLMKQQCCSLILVSSLVGNMLALPINLTEQKFQSGGSTFGEHITDCQMCFKQRFDASSGAIQQSCNEKNYICIDFEGTSGKVALAITLHSKWFNISVQSN